jgi:hypothetical protein
VALYQRMRPIIEKTEQKRTTYGPYIVEIIRRLFELRDGRKDVIVDLKWPALVPKDMLLEAQAYQIYTTTGVLSAATVTAKIGENPDVERENMEKEQAAQDEREMAKAEGQAKIAKEYAPKPAVGAGPPK